MGVALACEAGNFPTVSFFLLHGTQRDMYVRVRVVESGLRVVAITRGGGGQFLPHRASEGNSHIQVSLVLYLGFDTLSPRD